MERNRYSGIIPALMTPTDPQENVDFKALENHLEYLIRKGIRGVYLTGSTGEGFLLSDEERNAVVEAVCRICRGRIVVIAHTGTISVKRAAAMSGFAQEAGVDGISSVPPYYYKFSRPEIINYYASLASATSLPFFVYNIPATTGVDLSVNLLERLFEEKNICGLKYTSGDIYTMEQVVRLPSQPVVFSGSDEMSFYGLWAGAQALVGSSYNLLADVNVAMFEAFEQKDFPLSHRHYQLASRLLAVLLRYPYFSAVRRVLAWEGCDIGYGRAPFARLSSAEEKDLRRGLRDVVANFKDCRCSLADSL